jgi:hypothetical protein
MIDKNSNKGFALPVSLMLLVVMTLMGVALVSVTSSDMSSNTDRDDSSQAFYAAESGITMAKHWLKNQINYTSGGDPNNQLKFCKTSLFPNLINVKALRDQNNNNLIGTSNLGNLISATGAEKTRLDNFSYEYFITLTPDSNGNTTTPQKKPGTNDILYTIFSCGCDASNGSCSSSNNNIIALEAVVTIKD